MGSTPGKTTHTTISRKASNTPGNQEKLKPYHERLIEQVAGICQWADGICKDINRRVSKRCSTELQTLADEIAGYRRLGLHVIDQASRRVLDGEQVPNDQKVFSLFESHAELLKRGKAGTPIEYGHMIQIQQVECKFITAYDVFDEKPNEHTLVEPALARHKELFGSYPDSIAADKGYYESMEAIETLNKNVKIVSIAKKGKRTEDEKLRESDPEFRFAQRFRAGAEGGISYLKRNLGLFRCFTRGWEHYVSTVAATISHTTSSCSLASNAILSCSSNELRHPTKTVRSRSVRTAAICYHKQNQLRNKRFRRACAASDLALPGSSARSPAAEEWPCNRIELSIS